MTVRFPLLEPLEIATGLFIGRPVRPVVQLPSIEAVDDPRRALQAAILPALLRPPCLVSFSGGRDSSAVLAVAVHLARAEGLPDPVPMTLRFSTPKSQEDAWQEGVVRHLALEDWQRVNLRDELDVVGRAATSVLTAFGLYLPCNLHFHVPIIEAAAGGSLLTGVGGDEIFRRWPSRLTMLRELRRDRSRRAMLELAMVVAPMAARRGLVRWRRPLHLSWLRPAVAQEVDRIWARRQAVHLATYQQSLDAFLAGRTVELLDQCLSLVGRSYDVVVRHPFLDRGFLANVASSVPADGFQSRTAAMTELVGDLLPPSALRRSTKASFTDVFWGPVARDFARRWDGTGVDAALVDPDALKAVWGQPVPPWRSWTLLQQAWLAGEPEGDRQGRPAHRGPACGHPRSEAG